MTKKEKHIMGEIDMRRSPISPVPVDSRTDHIHESPADVGIIPFPRVTSSQEPFSFPRVALKPRSFTFK